MDEQSESSSPSLSLVTKDVDAQKGRVRNLSQWLHTWNMFLTVFLHFRPHLVSQLLGYQESITQLAGTYFANYWLAYDAAFRQKRANNPFLPWDGEDTQLFIAYLRTAPVLASAALPVSSSPATTSASGGGSVAKSGNNGSSSRSHAGKRCYNCQTYGHIAPNCPYAPGAFITSNPAPRPPPGPSSTQAPAVPAVGMASVNNNMQQPFRAPQRNQVRHQQASGFCFEWNNTGQCQQPGCRRDHRCSYCTQLHPRRECDQYPPNQQ